MISFSQCSTAKKFQKTSPFEIGDVYYQHWVAGIQGGGSGINLFIPLVSNPNNIVLDSIYFKGKQVKPEVKSKQLFIPLPAYPTSRRT